MYPFAPTVGSQRTLAVLLSGFFERRFAGTEAFGFGSRCSTATLKLCTTAAYPSPTTSIALSRARLVVPQRRTRGPSVVSAVSSWSLAAALLLLLLSRLVFAVVQSLSAACTVGAPARPALAEMLAMK